LRSGASHCTKALASASAVLAEELQLAGLMHPQQFLEEAPPKQP
jgi:hypothetical protein